MMASKVWKWICITFALIVAAIGATLSVLIGRDNRSQDIDSVVKRNTQEAKDEMYEKVRSIADDPDPGSRNERIDDWTSEGFE